MSTYLKWEYPHNNIKNEMGRHANVRLLGGSQFEGVATVCPYFGPGFRAISGGAFFSAYVSEYQWIDGQVGHILGTSTDQNDSDDENTVNGSD